MLVTNYCNLKASTSCLDPKYSLLIGQNQTCSIFYSMLEGLDMRILQSLQLSFSSSPLLCLYYFFFFFLARR